ncbi:MAG: DNA-directed RNA polymerase subunit beta [Parcubacteria group bacterium]|nr:DNA-directed RNA polymerase subunit beta [Parcubacteria group bacterium]
MRKNSLPLLERHFFTRRQAILPLPSLAQVQVESYEWFLKEGIRELLDEIAPIKDFTGEQYELSFRDYYFDNPKFNDVESKRRNATFEAPLRVEAELTVKETGEVKEQEVFLGDIPLMTSRGTFVINGVERVVVSQLYRSPGVFFTSTYFKGRNWYGAKIIPTRGAWLEVETDPTGVISVRIDRKRKVPVTALLRAFGYGTNEEILALFRDVETDPELAYIGETLKRDPSHNQGEGYKEVYKRIRPGDLATVENARSMIDAMFFNFERYDFGKVGRYKLNERLKGAFPNDPEHRVLIPKEFVAIIHEVIRLNVIQGLADDIDHLGNRRVRSVGELVQSKFRVGLLRTERIIKDRMSSSDPATITPTQLINIRPIVASLREFFASSQLSQFMDQTNPLAELEHKRRLSALGPGGLSRERAGFDVRDVHFSHYGRICPIQTPEGPNIGLVGHLTGYARINPYGFIETPYRKVLHVIKNTDDSLVGHELVDEVKDERGRVVATRGSTVQETLAKELAKLPPQEIPVRSYVSETVEYFNANQEEAYAITPADTPLDEQEQYKDSMVVARVRGEPKIVPVREGRYCDIAAQQIISTTTSLIPFLEHDDANRALMGTNMQRQAVSCVLPEPSIVGTGYEHRVAIDSGQIVIAKRAGKVVKVDGAHIVVRVRDGGEDEYTLLNFVRSNTSTSIHQKPIVDVGDEVAEGDILSDGPAIAQGELSLGQNLLVAFMSWDGGNYEDAILISERVVAHDRYTSIHIEDFRIDIRDTKLGPEIVTRDIPNVSEEKLKDLDENGIVRIGASVSAGDILVGKITPKGETDLTPEERLLRAIFGEKARDVKDTSLRLPHGEHGKVVDVKIFSREEGHKLPTGVIRSIQVSVAQLRKVQVGDKLAGRHGNKGIISRIVPIEDMPFLEDGTPVDVILNPLGVASRMNIGQILETHLGWAASRRGHHVASPALDGVTEETIKAELKEAGLPQDGKVTLYDGRTGVPFDHPVTVGVAYIMKLHHLVEDKIHARSTGPYSLVTQQPLCGKAQFGGQSFGEMEVWALEAYGAAHTLQEMLTIKSDDVLGRSKTYEAIVKGEEIRKPNIPESFHVLVKELESLGLSVELIGAREEGALPESAVSSAAQLLEADDEKLKDRDRESPRPELKIEE